MPKKILFISHDASRSGAPFVLLYLIQWLRQHSSYTIDILFLNGGPLQSEFEKVAIRCFVASKLLAETRLNRQIRKITGRNHNFDTDLTRINKKVDFASYSVVYGNTIVTVPWLNALKNVYGLAIIAALHELTYSLEAHVPRLLIKEKLLPVDAIIAGSEAVAENLVGRYSIPKNKITVAHGFIPTIVEQPVPNRQLLTDEGVSPGSFIIGCAGYSEWRKGTDLIIPLALWLQKHLPQFDYTLVWLGADLNLRFVTELFYDIEKFGLQDRVVILPNKPNHRDYLALFDVFAMLSREDPFPLVSLEAAYLGKPIVMFEGTGGTAELLVNGGGKIVPYLDIEQLGQAIYYYASHLNERQSAGALLKKEVAANYTSDVVSRKVLSVLDGLLQVS